MLPIFYVSYIALWLLVVIQSVLLLLVYRHFGLAAMGKLEGIQRDGLSLGEIVPPLEGVEAQGHGVQWVAPAGRPSLVLFATPECEPCGRVLPLINQLAQAALDGVIVVSGSEEGVTRLVDKFHPSYLCVADGKNSLFDRYRVRVTPFAFVIGEDGRVRAKGLCNDPIKLQDLLRAGGLDSVASKLKPATLPILDSKGTQLTEVTS